MDLTHPNLGDIEIEGLVMKLSDFEEEQDEAKLKFEYNAIIELFKTDEVKNALMTDEIYDERNRYSDVLPYRQTRVKLRKGVGKEKNAQAKTMQSLMASLSKDTNIVNDIPDVHDYINACYVNSPFEKVNSKTY